MNASSLTPRPRYAVAGLGLQSGPRVPAPQMLSHLQRDSAGGTSLDARVRQVRRASPNGVLRIVSFSGFGEELREAWDGDEKQRRAIRSKLSSLASDVSPFDAIVLVVTNE